MKAIMISIKPEYVAKILNGKKTIEIRKTMPKCDLPIDVYIYCTKEKRYTKPLLFANTKVVSKDVMNRQNVRWANGKVVAKFTLKKCQEWHNYSWQTITECGCVSDNELREYSKGLKSLYLWHIENLVIFDKPRELSEFYLYCKDEKCEYRNNHCSICYRTPLSKAPQNFCYVEDSKDE